MTPGKNRLFLTVAAAIAAWIVGTVVIGFADISYVTAAGVVDMRDPHKIAAAANDPSFSAVLSFGVFTLRGMYWSLLLPVGIALIAIIGTLAITRARK